MSRPASPSPSPDPSPSPIQLGGAALAGAAPGQGEGRLCIALAPRARAALEHISEGRDPERLIVAGACAIAALARAFGWGRLALASERLGAGASVALRYVVDLDGGMQLGALIGALDAAFVDAQAGPLAGDGDDEADAVEIGLGYAAPEPGRYALHLRLRVDAEVAVDVEAGLEARELVLELRWDRRRVAPRVAAALARSIARALLALEAPGCRLDALALLDDDDEAALRALAGDLAGDLDSLPGEPATLLERFSDAVARFPERTALIDGDRRIPYAELDDRSRRLATHLRACYGLEAGDLVGVLTSERALAIEAILAILRAGAAWLPLDHRQPPARINAILHGLAETRSTPGQPKLLLIDAERLFDLGEGAVPLYALDVQREHLACAPIGDDAAAGLDARAYAIATSGSTGAPKLVEVGQRSIAHYIAWKIDYHRLDEHAVRLLLAPLAFDSSVSDLFSMLAVGGCLVSCSDSERLDAEALARRVEATGVTIFAVVPSHYRTLLSALRPGALRSITVAGERVTRSLVAAHGRRLPGVRLVNEYGPSEATIAATACTLWSGEGEGEGEGDPPIGRPIRGAGVIVLDAAGRPTAAGLAGEIAVFGRGLARGYLGDPDHTAARFVPAPALAAPHALIYKTGDLGCWRDDGQLAFLGRVDDQLKIRGNRVELGEIEAALRRHRAVVEAAVVASRRGDELGLAAFVVTAVAIADTELRRFLGEQLPSYMVPATVTVIAEMPRTGNGKLDRRALVARAEAPAQPSSASSTSASAQPSPSEDPIAGALLQIWREVLEIADLGLDDNFFERGGHSLQAARIVARARAEIGRELPLRALFRRPTVRALAQLMAADPQPARAPIQPVADADDYPASETQRRLWALTGLAAEAQGSADAYAMCEAFEVSDLDLEALRRALDALARRHEILRTGLQRRGGALRQVVAASVEVPLTVHALPAGAGEAQLQALAHDALARPFALERAPLWRCVVVERPGDASVVLLLLHHVIADGPSIAALFAELQALYRGGGESPAPALQYRDFASWSEARERAPAGEAERRWWLETLADLQPAPELPLDHPRVGDRPRRGGERRRALDPELLAGLDQLTRRCGATRFAGLVALVALWLRRISEAEVPVLGTVFGGRERPELAGMIGPMLATLPLCCPIEGERGLAAAIERCAAVCRGAFTHAELPFDRIVEALAPPRVPGRHPLFDVMVTIDDQASLPLAGDGVFRRIAPERLFARWSAKFDLTVALRPTATGVELVAEFDAGLFTAARIDRALAQLLTLLRAGLEDPQAPIATLALLDADERERLAGFSRGPSPTSALGDLVAGFDRWADARPDHPALIDDHGSLSYAALRQRSQILAAALRRRGLGPGQVIATALGRGSAALVAWLGILRAGAAYLPLEPDWPEPHVRALLQASAAAAVIVVADTSNPPALTDEGPPRLELASLEREATEEQAPRTPPLAPGDPAYLMFTSGSSGTPRGAVIEQRSVVNLAEAYASSFAIDGAARVAWTASVGFDASIAELWPALLAGATLLPIGDALVRDLPALVRWLGARRVSHCYLPTAVVSLLGSLRGSAFALDPELTLITGGEALTLERLPVPRLVNAYGPTECCVCATWGWVDAGELPGAPTIGRPLANVEILVLDRHGGLAPIGVDGEICIAGRGLAQTLLGPARETGFAPHPFAPGRRIYHTGDRGRWLADGRLQFRGRRDRQLSVRGRRLEPAMIERRLLAHPEVRSACVLDSEGGELVAFVTIGDGDGDGELDGASLREHVAAALPAFMVPDRIERWPASALPRTHAGKIDRAALALVDAAPRSPIEGQHPLLQIVCALWAEVLGRPQVGAEDDFFALGGHSLTAMELCARLTELLELELPVRALFEHPRPLALIAEIEARRGAGSNSPRAALPVDPRGPWPLSPTQAQLLALTLRLPKSGALNLEQRLRLRGPLDLDALARACERLCLRRPILACRFDPARGEAWRGDYDRESFAALGLVDVDGDAREPIAALVLAREAERPFDLLRGMPWRVVALELGPDDHVLQLVVHHIVADARSFAILRDELLTLYAAARREGGEPEPEPEPAIGPGYGDLARRWAEAFAAGDFAASLAYWRRCLAGPLPAFLPQGPGEPGEHGPLASASVALELGAAELERLRAAARRRAATPYMLGLAALVATLERDQSGEEIRITSNISTRAGAETQGMIGPLVNTVVLRFAGGGGDLEARLRQARALVLEAFAHRELPFELALAEQDDADRVALASAFPVMFLYAEAEAGALPMPAVPGLEIEALAAGDAVGDAMLTSAELLFSLDLDVALGEGGGSERGARLGLVYKRRSCTQARAQAYLEQLRRELARLSAVAVGLAEERGHA